MRVPDYLTSSPNSSVDPWKRVVIPTQRCRLEQNDVVVFQIQEIKNRRSWLLITVLAVAANSFIRAVEDGEPSGPSGVYESSVCCGSSQSYSSAQFWC